jgi:serine/threonine-protein kinase RsbT
MSRTKTITVANEFDVILLRLVVRDLACAIGMNLGDQARISLAASAAAKAIGLGYAHRGQATVGDYNRDGRTGAQVVCTVENGKTDHVPSVLGDARWMVDELTIETLPSKGTQVTLVKWRE